MTDPKRWTLAIHGGSGAMARDNIASAQDAGARAGLAAALAAGEAVLAADGAALDAVEAAVRVLEDDPHFNAGRGAAFAFDGSIELDAAIMDGETRAAGAVAAVRATRNPVSLARRVMTATPHVLLAGAGADIFSVEQGLDQAGADWFVLPERADQLERMKASADWFDVDMKYGTVGAVARDTHGHVAAATSTGGVTGKRWGRIGDSPLIGAGTYADDRACAVSATGSGEYFIRVGAGHEIAARIRLSGDSVETATRAVLAEIAALGGKGGIIVAGADGTLFWHFTTPGMYRARIDASGARAIAIYGDE